MEMEAPPLGPGGAAGKTGARRARFDGRRAAAWLVLATSLPRNRRMRFHPTPPRLAFVFALALVSLLGAASSAAASPVAWLWSGGVTEHSAVVTTRVTAEGEVTLRAEAEGGVAVEARPLLEAPMEQGRLLRFALEGLAPDTVHALSLRDAPGRPLDDETRELRTFPRPGQPTSFRFALSSCARDPDSPVFSAAMRQGARFFLHTGDFHYSDIAINQVELFRAAYDRHLSAPRLRAMLARLPMPYQWDDHDFGPNDSDRRSPSRPASLRNFLELVPSYPLPVRDEETAELGGPTDHAFTVGRVRFILSDLRSRRDPPGRRMINAAQDAWLREELRAAKGRYPLIFWVSSVPWNGAPGGGTDRWQGYPEHRAEIANFIRDEGITGVCILSGDAHMTAIDDGTNADFAEGGGAPLRIFQAGPLANRGSYKAGPYSHGARADTPEGGRLYQFGLVDVEDDGTSIRVRWSGREGADGVGDQVLRAQRWGSGPIEHEFIVR